DQGSHRRANAHRQDPVSALLAARAGLCDDQPEPAFHHPTARGPGDSGGIRDDRLAGGIRRPDDSPARGTAANLPRTALLRHRVAAMNTAASNSSVRPGRDVAIVGAGVMGLSAAFYAA